MAVLTWRSPAETFLPSARLALARADFFTCEPSAEGGAEVETGGRGVVVGVDSV